MVVCVPHREREYLAAATDLGRLRIDAACSCRRSWGSARRTQQLLRRELPHQPDAHALATLLNSSLAAVWLNSFAEPARGGYRRYLGWTLSLFPIPRNWNRARVLLAALYERAIRDDLPSDAEILSAALDGYELDLV